MKAIVHDRYGSPEVLRLEDVPLPAPGRGQVRVRIHATSINLSDWEGLTGSPGYARMGGLRRPARRVLGSDIAGVVDEVGEGVTGLQPGDEVYGDNLALMGGFAEFAVAAESSLARKPAGLSFVEASTIPQAGAIALKGTTWAAPGRRVLVNGAGGGSGTFAIQLAKRLGAHVTGVDNAGKLDFMRSWGRTRSWTTARTTSPAAPRRTTSSSTSSRTARCSRTGGRWRLAGPTGASVARSGRCCACSPSAGWPDG